MQFSGRPYVICALLAFAAFLFSMTALAQIDDAPFVGKNPEKTVDFADTPKTIPNFSEFSVDAVQADNRKKTVTLHIGYHDPSRSMYADILFSDVVAYNFPLSGSFSTVSHLKKIEVSQLSSKDWQEIADQVHALGMAAHGNEGDIPASELLSEKDHGASYFKQNQLSAFTDILQEKQGWIIAKKATVHLLL